MLMHVKTCDLYTTGLTGVLKSKRKTTGQPFRGQKFHSSASNYEWNLERTRISSQSTRPVDRVLWEELLVHSSFTLKFEGETSYCEIFLSVY